MFAALGVGAWTAAIFHLMTHGFFKGLLFLDSGSVIHAVHDEQDMRRMGGLWRRIPITYWTMLVGAVAISGIPPLAGFFSKDEILGESFKNGFLWVWAIGFVVAALTAFYMFRLIGMTFWGESRVDPHRGRPVRRAEPVIDPAKRDAVRARLNAAIPSWYSPALHLAIPSAVLGLLLGFPPESGIIDGWLEPVFAPAIQASGRQEAAFAVFGIDGLLLLASATVAVVGILVAWRFFGVELFGLRARPRPEAVAGVVTRTGWTRFLYRASLNKWWFDDLNDLIFVRIGGRFAAALWWFDREVVDGTVNAIGSITSLSGRRLSRVQTGRVQNYALGIAVGLIVMAGSYLLIAGRR